MKRLLWIAVLMCAQWAVGQDCAKTVPANVLDMVDHHTIPAIEADRLHGSMGNSPVVISKVERIKGNRILLLIDVSGSQEPDRVFLQSLVELLLEKTPPGSPIAYGFFSDHPLPASGFTTDPKELSAAAGGLRSMKLYGSTALFDALHEGLKLFQTPLPGDSILVLSDGGENHSNITEGNLSKELKASGVRVFAILQANGSMVPEDVAGPLALNGFAAQTGGAIYTLPFSRAVWSDKKSRAELVDTVRTFWLDGVGSGYLLTVEVPVDLKKNARWKLQLDRASDKRLKNATVLYPRQLAPCAITSAAAR